MKRAVFALPFAAAQLLVAARCPAQNSTTNIDSPQIGVNNGVINVIHNDYHYQTITAPPGLSDEATRRIVDDTIRQWSSSWWTKEQHRAFEDRLRRTMDDLKKKTRLEIDAINRQVTELDAKMVQAEKDLDELRDKQRKDGSLAEMAAARLARLETTVAAARVGISKLELDAARRSLAEAAEANFWYAGRWHLSPGYSYETSFKGDRNHYVRLSVVYDTSPSYWSRWIRAVAVHTAPFVRFGRIVGGFSWPLTVLQPTPPPLDFSQLGGGFDLGLQVRLSPHARVNLLIDLPGLRLGFFKLTSTDDAKVTLLRPLLAFPCAVQLGGRVLPFLAIAGEIGATYDVTWVRPVWSYTGFYNGGNAKILTPSGERRMLFRVGGHVEFTI
jgi:hypothetical protein